MIAPTGKLDRSKSALHVPSDCRVYPPKHLLQLVPVLHTSQPWEQAMQPTFVLLLKKYPELQAVHCCVPLPVQVLQLDEHEMQVF